MKKVGFRVMFDHLLVGINIIDHCIIHFFINNFYYNFNTNLLYIMTTIFFSKMTWSLNVHIYIHQHLKIKIKRKTILEPENLIFLFANIFVCYLTAAAYTTHTLYYIMEYKHISTHNIYLSNKILNSNSYYLYDDDNHHRRVE